MLILLACLLYNPPPLPPTDYNKLNLLAADRAAAVFAHFTQRCFRPRAIVVADHATDNEQEAAAAATAVAASV